MRTYDSIFKRYPLRIIVMALDEYYDKIADGFNKYDIGFELKVNTFDKSIRDYWYGSVAEIVVEEVISYLREELCYDYIPPAKRKRVYLTTNPINADECRKRFEKKLQANTTYGMCSRSWDDLIREKKKDKTVQDVFNELTNEQKNVVYFMVGKAIERQESELKAKDEEIDELKEDLHNAEYQVKCWTRRCDELQKRLYEVKGVIEE